MSHSLIEIPARFFRWLKIGLATHRLKKLSPTEREQAQKALANLLGESRGITMKIGQVIAGDDMGDPFRPLITSIKPLSLFQIMPTLQSQYQQPVEQVFKDIQESQAAASLGQVHHAQLPDGTDVAVKIRYPGITDTINAELKLTDWLPSAGPFKRWKFDSDDYKATLRRQIQRETDYGIEAKTQQRFRQNLKIDGLHIPKIHDELTREAVMVQSWEDGCRFEEVYHWHKKQRLEVARTLLVTLFQSLFVHGEVHGDPHNGNYLFRMDENGKPLMILLDYGCTVLVSKSRRLALLKLIDAYRNKTQINPLQCFVAMGFDADKLSHINEQMPALCEALFLPFTQQRAFVMDDWQLADKLKRQLAEQRWWFRAAGPADLMLLLRAFHGLILHLEKLNVSLPWGALLHYAVGEELMQEARDFVLPEINVKAVTTHTVKITARKLAVRVFEDDRQTLWLDLPAEAALELESIIPSAVLEEIKSSADIDLVQLTADLQHKGVSPQLLFETDNGVKRCRVWLE